MASARLLDERDGMAVRAVLAADPVACCMVAARVESAGLDAWRLGGELWGADVRPMRNGRLDGLCYVGPNLIPLRGKRRAGRLAGPPGAPPEQGGGVGGERGPDGAPPRGGRRERPLMAIGGTPLVK